MKNIEKLYQKLSEIDNEEFYLIEGELFQLRRDYYV